MQKLNKLGQHEIVGFVLIVLIVVVIGVFLLVFYVRQEPPKHESLDVQNLLQSSMLYTTSCAISFEPQYDNTQDLIKSCYKGQQCLDGNKACDILQATLTEIMHQSLQASKERPINSYSMFIYHQNEEIKSPILNLSEGTCAGSKTGAEHLISYSPGKIVVSLEICYT